MEKNESYWARVAHVARELGSDGCSVVTEMYQPCCHEHDIHYRTGVDMAGRPITRREADAEFRRCIQRRSRLGRLSPVAAVRWIGVRIGGWWGWRISRRKDT